MRRALLGWLSLGATLIIDILAMTSFASAESGGGAQTQTHSSCWKEADEDLVARMTPLMHVAHGHNWMNHCDETVFGVLKHFIRTLQITEIHGTSEDYCTGLYGTFRKDGELLDSTDQFECTELVFWQSGAHQVWPSQSHPTMTSYGEHNWVYQTWDKLDSTSTTDSSR